MQRTWILTKTGFQTTSFKNLQSGKEWCGKESVYSSDWGLPKRIENDTKGELISVECIETDAYQHSQSYAALSAFMAAPSCFMLTQLLEPAERDELRKIISIYKENRKEIFESYVFPIGDEPNNTSWTGFQVYHPEKKTGYLMVFRELHNNEISAELELKFIQNKKVQITNLENNQSETIECNNGKVKISIVNPAGYRFLKYEVLD